MYFLMETVMTAYTKLTIAIKITLDEKCDYDFSNREAVEDSQADVF